MTTLYYPIFSPLTGEVVSQQQFDLDAQKVLIRDTYDKLYSEIFAPNELHLEIFQKYENQITSILKMEEYPFLYGYLPDAPYKLWFNLYNTLFPPSQANDYELVSDIIKTTRATLVNNNNFFSTIHQEFYDRGYIWMYTGFYKRDQRHVARKLSSVYKDYYEREGSLPITFPFDMSELSPENFEQYTTLVSMDSYFIQLNNIKNNNIRQRTFSSNLKQNTGENYLKNLGFSKKELGDAILKKSNRNKYDSYPNNIIKLKQLFTKTLADNVKITPFYHASKYRRRIRYSLEFTYPKCYYEVLYRAIFNTLGYVDWEEVCKNNLLSLDILKTVAVETFQYNPNLFENKNSKQVCQYLSKATKTIKESKQKVKELVTVITPDVSSSVIYQPGSLALRSSEGYKLSQESGLFLVEPVSKPTIPQYQQDVIKRITDICMIDSSKLSDNEKNVNLLQILKLAIELNITDQMGDLNKLTIEKACQVFNNYYNLLLKERKALQ